MSTPEYHLPEACQAAPSLEDWLKAKDTEEACKPCVLPVALQWYVETLDENGLPEMARGLEQTAKEAPRHRSEDAKRGVGDHDAQRVTRCADISGGPLARQQA